MVSPLLLTPSSPLPKDHTTILVVAMAGWFGNLNSLVQEQLQQAQEHLQTAQTNINSLVQEHLQPQLEQAQKLTEVS